MRSIYLRLQTKRCHWTLRFLATFDSDSLERKREMTNSIQVNFSHSLVIGGHSEAWMAAALYRCAPPARVVGRRLRQEDTLRDRRGGAIVRPGPGAPRGFQIPSCDGRPLAPFQIGTISLKPLIPPHTHRLPLSSPVLCNKQFHSGLQAAGGQCLGIQSDMA